MRINGIKDMNRLQIRALKENIDPIWKVEACFGSSECFLNTGLQMMRGAFP